MHLLQFFYLSSPLKKKIAITQIANVSFLWTISRKFSLIDT